MSLYYYDTDLYVLRLGSSNLLLIVKESYFDRVHWEDKGEIININILKQINVSSKCLGCLSSDFLMK